MQWWCTLRNHDRWWEGARLYYASAPKNAPSLSVPARLYLSLPEHLLGDSRFQEAVGYLTRLYYEETSDLQALRHQPWRWTTLRVRMVLERKGQTPLRIWVFSGAIGTLPLSRRGEEATAAVDLGVPADAFVLAETEPRFRYAVLRVVTALWQPTTRTPHQIRLQSVAAWEEAGWWVRETQGQTELEEKRKRSGGPEQFTFYHPPESFGA
ncbi:MAG: hypothetical protein KatS3mg115_0601 [Candidatus Poribacteria bacterium]|nr:MAG: hypothetical protein KatS3mg115_0601 [Candidatus Poribacteria bacterium]